MATEEYLLPSVKGDLQRPRRRYFPRPDELSLMCSTWNECPASLPSFGTKASNCPDVVFVALSWAPEIAAGAPSNSLHAIFPYGIVLKKNNNNQLKSETLEMLKTIYNLNHQHSP